jgi:CubicO group peptidase (beta-lactamase class C family)
MVRFDRDTLHDLRSVTKSVTGTLMGIAIGAGIVHMSGQRIPIFPGARGSQDRTQGRDHDPAPPHHDLGIRVG